MNAHEDDLFENQIGEADIDAIQSKTGSQENGGCTVMVGPVQVHQICWIRKRKVVLIINIVVNASSLFILFYFYFIQFIRQFFFEQFDTKISKME